MIPQFMVAIEGTSLLFLLVVFSAYIVSPRPETKKTDWFLISLIFTIAGVVTDLISWMCELGPAVRLLQCSANFLALIMTNIIVSAFGYYTIEQISVKHTPNRKIPFLIVIANVIGVLSAALGLCLGKLFDIHANPSVPGALIYDDGGIFYDISLAISAVSLAVLFVITLHYAKNLGRRKITVFSIYFLLPLLTSIVELIDNELLFSYVAISLSITIVYAMLQSNQVNTLLVREQILHELSYKDQLTGLLNRRACDRDIAQIRNDDTVHIVFCDLNGLKRINDEKGHNAGDEFLIQFSKILTNHFPHEAVYRISGDEFLVITYNMSSAVFEASVNTLQREITENAGMAALGTITGTGDAIPDLIKKAEMCMYVDKKEFYRKNPAYRRSDAYTDREELPQD